MVDGFLTAMQHTPKDRGGVTQRMEGAVTLGDIVGRVRMLEIACRHCERYGRLRVDKLIAEHGADFTLPYLRERLAGDCPRLLAAWIYERCGAYFPQPETKDQ
jgi:hypothetical protein